MSTADYWHHLYKCPYMYYTEKSRIHCENGTRIVFYHKNECHKYIHTYCCDRWHQCNIAKMLEEHYDYELFKEKGNTETDGSKDDPTDQGHGEVLG